MLGMKLTGITRLNPLILAMLLCLGACAGKSEEKGAEPDMTVSVDFLEVHRCSRISPEITVAYAPRGTKFYDVRLVEFGRQQERYLGGGIWPADQSGIIPEGALTRHYMGPCPPDGQEIDYAYYVSALESPDSQPLMVRRYKFRP